MRPIKCLECDSECESIPYPHGERYICPSCGLEYCDADAMDYKRHQRREMDKLIETLNKSDRFTQRYIKGDPQ